MIRIIIKWKLYLLILIIGCAESNSVYQTEIDYFPDRRESLTDKQYQDLINVLKQTYDVVKKDSMRLYYIHHLNIAHIFARLGEPKERVTNELNLAIHKDIESTAELFIMAFKEPNDFNLTVPEYDSLFAKFTKVMANKVEVKIDPVEYAIENNLDVALVKLMAYLKEKDQEFRPSDMNMQQLIDEKNIQIIDSLFEIHKKYIGISLVGNKYKTSMWAVIQHADLEHQEKYLPVVHDGVMNGELPAAPLKMLIDRIYNKRIGYQIFGSQSNVSLASDEIIQQVKNTYNLD